MRLKLLSPLNYKGGLLPIGTVLSHMDSQLAKKMLDISAAEIVPDIGAAEKIEQMPVVPPPMDESYGAEKKEPEDTGAEASPNEESKNGKRK